MQRGGLGFPAEYSLRDAGQLAGLAKASARTWPGASATPDAESTCSVGKRFASHPATLFRACFELVGQYKAARQRGEASPVQSTAG
jgi:hypothetical protein